MDAGTLVREHPVLFHVAAAGAWPSIRRHGLLSTAAVVRLCSPPGPVVAEVLGAVRRRSVVLEHPGHGRFTVRDQLPLRHLERCLAPGVTAREYLDALNSRVFLWASRDRVVRLLGAGRQRAVDSDVLHVDTARLLARHGHAVQLCPYNSGATFTPAAPRRGPGVFTDLADHPFQRWRSARGRRGDAVVEVVLPWAVPDIGELVTRVERWRGAAPLAGPPAERCSSPDADR